MPQQLLENIQPLVDGNCTYSTDLPTCAVAWSGVGGHADRIPGAPVYAQSGLSQRSAAMGQRVQESVGCGIVRLTGATKHRRDRRETHEQVQRHFRCGLMQMKGSSDLRSQHALESTPVQLHQHAVVQYTSRVEDSGQWRQMFADMIQQLIDISSRGYVGADHGDFGTRVLQPCDRLSRFGGRLPASSQY